MYDITTGTGDFIADGVVSHNCFARPTHEYLGLDTGRDFDQRIVVKVNAAERLRAELSPARWAGHHIAMGTQHRPVPAGRGPYRLTRSIIEVLGEAANPFSILTKSSLVLRDLDVLVAARGAHRRAGQPLDRHARHRRVAGHRARHAAPGRAGSRRSPRSTRPASRAACSSRRSCRACPTAASSSRRWRTALRRGRRRVRVARSCSTCGPA